MSYPVGMLIAANEDREATKPKIGGVAARRDEMLPFCRDKQLHNGVTRQDKC